MALSVAQGVYKHTRPQEDVSLCRWLPFSEVRRQNKTTFAVCNYERQLKSEEKSLVKFYGGGFPDRGEKGSC